MPYLLTQSKVAMNEEPQSEFGAVERKEIMSRERQRHLAIGTLPRVPDRDGNVQQSRLLSKVEEASTPGSSTSAQSFDENYWWDRSCMSRDSLSAAKQQKSTLCSSNGSIHTCSSPSTPDYHSLRTLSTPPSPVQPFHQETPAMLDQELFSGYCIPNKQEDFEKYHEKYVSYDDYYTGSRRQQPSPQIDSKSKSCPCTPILIQDINVAGTMGRDFQADTDRRPQYRTTDGNRRSNDESAAKYWKHNQKQELSAQCCDENVLQREDKSNTNSTKARRPDKLPLSMLTTTSRFSQGLPSSSMAATQDNAVKECWVENVHMTEELPSSVSSTGSIGRQRLAFTFPGTSKNIYAGNFQREVDERTFHIKSGSSFSGLQLLSYLSKSILEDVEITSSKTDLIQSMCKRLLELEVLEPALTNKDNNKHIENMSFKLSEMYRWAKGDHFYTPAQTPSSIQEEKMKKLRLHNKHLKVRLSKMADELSRLELQTQWSAADTTKSTDRPGTQAMPPCQIEVRSEGKSNTNVSMPSTMLSISTFSEGSGSHVSLSFVEPELRLPGYVTNSRTKILNKSLSNSPKSYESYVTAVESSLSQNSASPQDTVADQLPVNHLICGDNSKNYLSHSGNSSNQPSCPDSTNTCMNSVGDTIIGDVEHRRVSDDLSTLCQICKLRISSRKRLSNASIDSGLSQSYSSYPSNMATEKTTVVSSDEPKELHVSHSTPAFSTEFANAYAPTTPDGYVSSQNINHSKDLLSNQIVEEVSSSNQTEDNATVLVVAPPPPPPPVLGSTLNHTLPRRKPVKPKVNLRPLHWKRILIQNKPVGSSRSAPKSSTVWDKLQEPKVDADELEELFAVDDSKGRLVDLPSPMLTLKRKQFTKILERKRSQNLGIILSSIRQPFSEFKKALINFDVSFLTVDTWRSLYDARATEKELTEIQDQVETNPKCVLDKPEQFLYNLNCLSFGLERIKCFLLRSHFEEALRDMTSQLSDMTAVCEHMLSSPHIENLLSLLLAVGNYLNGGNSQRGQADGFSLDILPKLKDIRGKKQTSLLRYIASKYRCLYGGDRRRIDIPLPSHSTLESISCINYVDLSKQVSSLQLQIQETEELLAKVKSTLNDQNTNETFYNEMSSFVTEATKALISISTRVTESKAKFGQMCQFYSAPSAAWQSLTPLQFFDPWITFTKDLTQVWEVKGPPQFHSRVSAFF